MPELQLLADFRQTFLPIAFVRQRIGVRAPEFFHHFALRHERAFRLRIFERVLHLAQRQLRAGHDRRRAELRIQFVRRVVERAPAFRVGATPQRRLRVQPREIPERDSDLPHGFELSAHDAAKNFLQRRVESGIQKLRLAKTVAAADF